MQTLSLVTDVKALLTKTTAASGVPGDANYVPSKSFVCNLAGNEVPAEQAVPIYRDAYTGKTYAKADADAEGAIHFVDQHGDATGWYVPAPDYNNREPKADEPKPAEETAA